MKNPPERTTGDTVHAVFKSIASAVPTAGGPLSVLLETLFAPPIERRKKTWGQVGKKTWGQVAN